METTAQILRGKNLKATPQRIAVYKVLAQQGHATVEEVAAQVASIAPSISVATVYKVLDCLADAGLVARLSTPAGKLCYDATTAPHHHLFRADGRVVDYADEGLSQLIADYLAQNPVPQIEIERINLQLFCK